MLTRIDTISYTLPLTYLFEEVYNLNGFLYNFMYNQAEQSDSVKRRLVCVKKYDDRGHFSTFNELVETKAHNYSNGWEAAVVWSVESMLQEKLGLSVEVDQRLYGSKNHFRHHVRFPGGFVAFGGNNRVRCPDGSMEERPERMQVYFSGELCERLNSSDWSSIHDWSVKSVDVRISRCDICFDDFEGVYSYDYLIKQYLLGAFHSGKGRPPKARKNEELGGNADGNTFYVGSRVSGKLSRGYEKGKQLGDPDSKWMRHEGELLAQDRVIPFDIVISPDQYFAGLYPLYARMIEEQTAQAVESASIPTIAKKTTIIYQHLKNHCRIAYGRLISFMTDELGLDSSEIVDSLRDGSGDFPKRLSYLQSRKTPDYSDFSDPVFG
jgi:DNA relaxase NicK